MTYLDTQDLAQFTGGITASGARAEFARVSKAASGTYDIFLSHSFLDAVLVYGLKKLLESEGRSVYVDWLDDPGLDRNRVSTATAARLRERMGNCRALLYATSRNASASRWMPWELGLFDGRHGPEKVATCPIETGADDAFVGQEYLGLYKTLEKVRESDGRLRPYVVTQSRQQAQTLNAFVTGTGRYVRLS